MIVDTRSMFELRKTSEFNAWFDGLRDERAQATITKRLIRAELGHLGDAKFFDGIGELRIDYGPGYRLYFTRHEKVIVILLCGGDKSTQKRDIQKARKLAETL